MEETLINLEQNNELTDSWWLLGPSSRYTRTDCSSSNLLCCGLPITLAPVLPHFPLRLGTGRRVSRDISSLLFGGLSASRLRSSAAFFCLSPYSSPWSIHTWVHQPKGSGLTVSACGMWVPSNKEELGPWAVWGSEACSWAERCQTVRLAFPWTSFDLRINKDLLFLEVSLFQLLWIAFASLKMHVFLKP